jgi:hypothetical protein
MKTTPYFERRIAQRGIDVRWVEEALRHEVKREEQPDGRIRLWGYVQERKLHLRLVLLSDGETLLNAFFDSTFTRKQGRP